MPAFSQSRSNAAAGGHDARKGGAQAGDYHKSSIDALLNPKHAGAQPYRLVLGEVRKKVCRACLTQGGYHVLHNHGPAVSHISGRLEGLSAPVAFSISQERAKDGKC